MGLKDFFKRWSQKSDADAIARQQQGLAGEDFEARKDDASISKSFAGGESMEAADEELADD
jgi:hypothetical protein